MWRPAETTNNGVPGGSADLVLQMMQSAGQGLFDAEGNPQIADNELLLQCIEIYNEMKDCGVLYEIMSWDQQIAALNDGTSTGIVSGCWILASIQLAEDQSGKWAVTNIPSLPGVEGATNYSNLGGSTWVISSQCKNKELAADFFATTFGGSVDFFETVFPSTGLVSPYIPVAESGIYDKEQEFFGGQKVFADIAEYAQQVPAVKNGKFHYEAADAVGVAIQSSGSGGDLKAELQLAQEEVEFKMETDLASE
ncbi:MAG: extracellular solute-binding protein [Clostridiales bacterium]|nr:extracellular solute-binding protein [Clostridiales bacterium]